MGIGTGIVLIALGLILLYALEVDIPYVGDDALAWILILAGVVMGGSGNIAGAILGGTCTSPEDGNMTQCVGGLSEEGTAVAAGAIAAVVLVLQVTLIVLMTRRRRRPNS